MIEKICFCGHKEKSHKYLNMTVEQIINRLVKANNLVPQHSPNQMGAVGYYLPGENNHFYPYGEIEKMIVNLRENHSSCEKKFLSGCKCQKFEADNLKTLEKEYERKTSQVIK